MKKKEMILRAIEILRACQADLQELDDSKLNAVSLEGFCEHIDDVISDLNEEL